MADLLDDVLVSLRRILRATSIHSRKLGRSVGITSPQLMVLGAVNANDGLTATEVANAVSLSQATITAIVSKLEDRGLLKRERSSVDKRRVHVSLNDAGREVLIQAPKPLQESFSRRFEALPRWEQLQLVSSLERIARMMDAEDLDAAPVLTDHADLY
ncbi:MAG: DNA-binding MarR family transcriptional regulator [Glaciecola sp.]|jgi:DNA-binding MarR family transcriptional regulator|uniref:MarR family winged helix-turn-helix transcriptional regulator n=1 Tax=Congregibacter sp. TaxID=2744308 RepID=UPI0039E60D02